MLVKKQCPTTYRNTQTDLTCQAALAVDLSLAKKNQIKTPKRPHGAHYEIFHSVSSNKPFLLTLQLHSNVLQLLWFGACLRAKQVSLNHWVEQKQHLTDQSLGDHINLSVLRANS